MRTTNERNRRWMGRQVRLMTGEHLGRVGFVIHVSTFPDDSAEVIVDLGPFGRTRAPLTSRDLAKGGGRQMTPTPITDAYTEGRTAAQNDAARSDNPYIGGTSAVKREDWDDGWKTGRLESAFKEGEK